MDVLRIRGGTPLIGDVDVPGSKNASLAILSSVLLSQGRVVLHNVPDISDIWHKVKLLRHVGAKVEFSEGSLFIETPEVLSLEAEEEMVRPIRTSFYLLGPMLCRAGRASLPVPGGCNIGERPVDLHLKGLSAMGAKVELTHGRYEASVDHLRGAEIHLDLPSAGATQHLMSTATMAEGVTVITNAAIEPEVVSLAQFLQAMGAHIEGVGTPTITIHGRPQLGDAEFRIPADRMQAGTYLLAGAITGGKVTVRGILPEYQTAVLDKLLEAGLGTSEGHDWVGVAFKKRPKAIRVVTSAYPGFPTDMQQPMAALLATAHGTSIIEEKIYDKRVGHVKELNLMGAKMRIIDNRTTIIEGVSQLKGAVVEATDLRAGAALVLAALAADGESVIRNVHFVDRGYERLEETLTSLGATVRREREPDWTGSQEQRSRPE
jgi:UDP-N-acetylglucosamine 1-carboxyvinyltransferase